MVYEAWINRVAVEFPPGSDNERDAIQILAYMHNKRECDVWADIEKERTRL